MDKTLISRLYSDMYLIRRSEEIIIENYPNDEMKTPMHMSMGEEAIVVGVCAALKKEDQVFGTYRSHALYLAKTGDVDDFFAEMYGKATARLKGKGGSMHLCSPRHGHMGTSAIVASAIPVAVGAAFANNQVCSQKMSAVFFGDGAIDEGVFWESINAACLMKLPVLFVCEDNGFAVHTLPEMRHGYKSIQKVVSQFDCVVAGSETTDAQEIMLLTQKALSEMKKKKCPGFLHFKYYRYLEHVGINEDFDANYRSKEEYDKWKERDPVLLMRKKLISALDHESVNCLEERINDRIAKSLFAAREASFSSDSVAFKEVW